MPRPRRIWISPLVAILRRVSHSPPPRIAAMPTAGTKAATGGGTRSRRMDMEQFLQTLGRAERKAQDTRARHLPDRRAQGLGRCGTLSGHAAFRAPQLAFLDFRKVKMQEQADPKDKKKKVLVPVKKNNKIVSVPYETIVCTGQEVWHYRYDVKQIYIFPLDKDQRKRALEEGPLPFLFNMNGRRPATLPDGTRRTKTRIAIWSSDPSSQGRPGELQHGVGLSRQRIPAADADLPARPQQEEHQGLPALADQGEQAGERTISSWA